jgi:hypothetical protein
VDDDVDLKAVEDDPFFAEALQARSPPSHRPLPN